MSRTEKLVFFLAGLVLIILLGIACAFEIEYLTGSFSKSTITSIISALPWGSSAEGLGVFERGGPVMRLPCR